MKLYFTCPETLEVFATEAYKLAKGHRITENEDGSRELDGTVELTDTCPSCGKRHQYAVSEVMCPSSREKTNE